MNLKELMFYMVKEKQLTIPRAFNMTKCFISYKLKTKKNWGKPYAVMIEPTNVCNLRCPSCPTGNKTLTAPVGYMDLDHFKKVIDEMGDHIVHMTLWNFGEPLLNQKLPEMIEYAKKKNIFIRISANCNYLYPDEQIEKVVKAKLDNIIVAVDGATQESYEKYRVGGTLDNVKANVKRIVGIKKKLGSKYPFIELQFIVMKHNQHEIPMMEEMVKEVGADKLQLKTYSAEIDQSDDEDIKQRNEAFVPSNKELTRYKITGMGMIEHKKKIKNECHRLYSSTVINWDGEIVPCCYDPNRKFKLGNALDEEGFYAKWNGDKYQNMRRMIKDSKDKIHMCKNCTGKLASVNLN